MASFPTMPVTRREKRFKRAWRIVRPYDPVQQAEREAVDSTFRIA
jgi:hypothetical protein